MPCATAGLGATHCGTFPALPGLVCSDCPPVPIITCAVVAGAAQHSLADSEGTHTLEASAGQVQLPE